MYAFGSTIDSRTNATSGLPARRASAGRVSRAGPGLAFRPAGFNVGAPPPPVFFEKAGPGAARAAVVVEAGGAGSSAARPRARFPGRLPLCLGPGSERLGPHHTRLRSHEGMPLAAELRADDRVSPEPLRRDHNAGRDPGDD